LAAEHDLFLKGLNEHGAKWEKIAKTIKTRSISQVPSHAQKHFQMLLKEKKEDGGPGNALSCRPNAVPFNVVDFSTHCDEDSTASVVDGQSIVA